MKPDDIDQSPPVMRFRKSAEAFGRKHRDFGDLSSRAGKVRFGTRHRFGSSGLSVVAFCGIFAQVHREAVLASVQSTTLVSQLVSPMLPVWFSQLPFETNQQLPTAEELRESAKAQARIMEEFQAGTGKTWHQVTTESVELKHLPLASLHACYVSFFFLMRAFQDRAYCVLLELQGARAGRYSSMADALDKSKRHASDENPVGRFLAEACPEYLDWFSRFRDMRNDLKEGVPTSTCGPDEDLGMVINLLDEKNQGIVSDLRRGYRLGDAAEALERSVQLLNAAAPLAGAIADVSGSA